MRRLRYRYGRHADGVCDRISSEVWWPGAFGLVGEDGEVRHPNRVADF